MAQGSVSKPMLNHILVPEEKVRLEIEYLKNFECQLKQWESDYNSELTVSQLIADKTEKQKEEMSKAKQKQVREIEVQSITMQHGWNILHVTWY